VPALARKRRLSVGEDGFADHHVRVVSEGERGITQLGIDERETLAPPRLAHLLQRYQLVTGDETALALQAPDVGQVTPQAANFSGSIRRTSASTSLYPMAGTRCDSGSASSRNEAVWVIVSPLSTGRSAAPQGCGTGRRA
jgi:hypothetical protein